MLPTARGASPGARASHSVWVSPSGGDSIQATASSASTTSLTSLPASNAHDPAPAVESSTSGPYTCRLVDSQRVSSANAYRLRSGEAMPINRVLSG